MTTAHRLGRNENSKNRDSESRAFTVLSSVYICKHIDFKLMYSIGWKVYWLWLGKRVWVYLENHSWFFRMEFRKASVPYLVTSSTQCTNYIIIVCLENFNTTPSRSAVDIQYIFPFSHAAISGFLKELCYWCLSISSCKMFIVFVSL